MKVRGSVSAAEFSRLTGSLKCPKGVGSRRSSIQRTSLSFVTPHMSRRMVSHGAGAKRGSRQPSPSDSTNVLEHLPSLGREEIEHGLTMLWHERVQIYDVGDAFGHPIGHAGDDRARGAVPEEHNVAEILILQHIDNVVDVHVESDLGASEMAAFAEPRQCRSDDVVTALPQERGDFPPAPRPVPRGMYQDEHSLFHVLHRSWKYDLYNAAMGRFES